EDVVGQLDGRMGGEKIWVIKLRTVSASDMAAMLSSIFNVTKGGGAPAGGKRPNLAGGGAAPAGGGAGPPGSDLSVSQIIPDDRQNILVVVSTENAYRRILALVKRLDQMSMRQGADTT